MTEKELAEKLADFFTAEQISHIDAYALEMAIDAEIAPDDENLAHYIGRWHICECFTYWEREEIETAAGSPMTDDDWDAFLEQMEIEW